MKKFIAAFDGLHMSESTMRYAILFSKFCNAHLVGVFLEDFTRHSYGVADLTRYEGDNLDQYIHNLNEHEEDERKASIQKFEQACQHSNTTYSVHRDGNIALQELLHESIYADLLIIQSQETLTRYEEQMPSRFIKDILNDVQCPVVLVPAKYKLPDKIILLYDGEPSSVHAVRSFSYLFDPIKYLTTEVVTARNLEESLNLPDNRLIKEFIKRHYPKADYVVLKGNPEEQIPQYLLRQSAEPIIVLGAYKRGRMSRMFRPSMADNLLNHLKSPLFIAHNKS